MRGGLFARQHQLARRQHVFILQALAVRAFQADPLAAVANRVFQPHTILFDPGHLNYSILQESRAVALGDGPRPSLADARANSSRQSCQAATHWVSSSPGLQLPTRGSVKAAVTISHRIYNTKRCSLLSFSLQCFCDECTV